MAVIGLSCPANGRGSGIPMRIPPQNICDVNPYLCRMSPADINPKTEQPYVGRLSFEPVPRGCNCCATIMRPREDCESETTKPKKKSWFISPAKKRKKKEEEEMDEETRRRNRKHKQEEACLLRERRRRADFVTACCQGLMATPCGSAGSCSDVCEDREQANFYIQAQCEPQCRTKKPKKNYADFPCQCRSCKYVGTNDPRSGCRENPIEKTVCHCPQEVIASGNCRNQPVTPCTDRQMACDEPLNCKQNLCTKLENPFTRNTIPIDNGVGEPGQGKLAFTPELIQDLLIEQAQCGVNLANYLSTATQYRLVDCHPMSSMRASPSNPLPECDNVCADMQPQLNRQVYNSAPVVNPCNPQQNCAEVGGQPLQSNCRYNKCEPTDICTTLPPSPGLPVKQQQNCRVNDYAPAVNPCTPQPEDSYQQPQSNCRLYKGEPTLPPDAYQTAKQHKKNCRVYNRTPEQSPCPKPQCQSRTPCYLPPTNCHLPSLCEEEDTPQQNARMPAHRSEVTTLKCFPTVNPEYRRTIPQPAGNIPREEYYKTVSTPKTYRYNAANQGHLCIPKEVVQAAGDTNDSKLFIPLTFDPYQTNLNKSCLEGVGRRRLRRGDDSVQGVLVYRKSRGARRRRTSLERSSRYKRPKRVSRDYYDEERRRESYEYAPQESRTIDEESIPFQRRKSYEDDDTIQKNEVLPLPPLDSQNLETNQQLKQPSTQNISQSKTSTRNISQNKTSSRNISQKKSSDRKVSGKPPKRPSLKQEYSSRDEPRDGAKRTKANNFLRDSSPLEPPVSTKKSRTEKAAPSKRRTGKTMAEQEWESSLQPLDDYESSLSAALENVKRRYLEQNFAETESSAETSPTERCITPTYREFLCLTEQIKCLRKELKKYCNVR